MTQKEFEEGINVLCYDLGDTLIKKNRDYSGTDDPWSNFTRIEKEGVATTEQGFLTRMSDKFGRIMSLVNQPPKFEAFEDSLLDLAGYCILLNLYINKERK